MKKLKKVVCGVMLSASLLITSATPAVAETVNVYQNNKLVESVVFKINVPKYVVNDQTIVPMDVAPFIRSDRTFVPVRFLGNALGVDNSNITWDSDSQTATLKGNSTLQMTIDKAHITSNGVEKAIDVAPLLKKDRTFLPARYTAEGLGYQVDWDEATQTVVCWPAGQPKPDVSGAIDYFNNFVQTPQTPQQPVTDSNSNGYTVPSKTDLHVDIRPANDNPNKVDIDLCIRLEKPLEQQYQDAYSIITSKFGEKIAKEIVDYAKQKQKRFDNLPSKYWQVNGQKINVGSNPGDYWIEIIAWQPGV